MTPPDDWQAWARVWRAQAGVDVGRLRRRVRRKRLQMRLVVWGEALATLVAVAQIARLEYWWPGASLRWKVWGGLALALIGMLLAASIRLRRGTWRAVTDDVPGLLRLTAQRARVGIRLAWLNILSVPVLLAISLPFAAPWLAPSRWRHDPALRHMLLLDIGINGTALAALMLFYAWYIRRQRRRLQRIVALGAEWTEADGPRPEQPPT